jgi:hypothetical protein
MKILGDLSTTEKNGHRQVHPVFVKKNGAKDLSLDVSLSGKSSEYKTPMSEKEFKEFINNPKKVRDYPSATVRAAIKSEELGVNERSDRNGYLISRFSPVIHIPKDEITSKNHRGNQENTELCDEITLREIKTRRGQPAFRQALLTEFKSTCCITGCKIEAVLEAAHIIPHGDETNYSVYNGLLLRADVHTLFDLGLLRISEAGIVMVDSTLKNSEYFQHDGDRVMDSELPSEMGKNLRERNKHFNVVA